MCKNHILFYCYEIPESYLPGNCKGFCSRISDHPESKIKLCVKKYDEAELTSLVLRVRMRSRSSTSCLKVGLWDEMACQQSFIIMYLQERRKIRISLLNGKEWLKRDRTEYVSVDGIFKLCHPRYSLSSSLCVWLSISKKKWTAGVLWHSLPSLHFDCLLLITNMLSVLTTSPLSVAQWQSCAIVHWPERTLCERGHW